ncbi:STAS domain-containing protein [Calothrix sp. PCC 7507]|uniref:STAS domain-containing protein n=1 Tax=Calothrix sp. PCC 7507 TaxID=99598 RepID=UPI00029F45B7|nr:STAS domain-containing protein [Calothrix sp. PCC 7507]AFY33354.1 anti-sigma-factor antagonist [Calothrix sp. PCC 7507]
MQLALKSPKITVIRPHGCLNAANALEFERDLTTALAQDDTSILQVDLAAVESLDSAALMALVSTLKLAGKLGRSLRLCSVSPALRIIFELTQLDEVFEILESEATATA